MGAGERGRARDGWRMALTALTMAGRTPLQTSLNPETVEPSRATVLLLLFLARREPSLPVRADFLPPLDWPRLLAQK